MIDMRMIKRRLVYFSPALELINCSRREQGLVSSLPNRDLAALSQPVGEYCIWTQWDALAFCLLIIPVFRLWKKGFQSWQVEKIMIKFTQIESSVTEKKKSPGEIGKTTWIDFLRGARAHYTSKHVGVCDKFTADYTLCFKVTSALCLK